LNSAGLIRREWAMVTEWSRTVAFARPEIEEFRQLREMMQILLLPDEILQDAGVVRLAIEDVGGRQTDPFELAAEVDADYAASPKKEPEE
jgi:hypothetical protein